MTIRSFSQLVSTCSLLTVLLSHSAVAATGSQADTAASQRLAGELAACSGKLSATEQYDGYIEGLRENRIAAADALSYVLENSALPISKYSAIVKEQAETFEAELFSNPMTARSLMTSAKEDCAAPIAQAQAHFDKMQKEAAAKQAAIEEAARQQKMQAEAEAARARAEAEEKIEAAKQATLAAEAEASQQASNAAKAEAEAAKLRLKEQEAASPTSAPAKDASRAQANPSNSQVPKLTPMTCASFYMLTLDYAPASKREEQRQKADILFSASKGTTDQLVETSRQIAEILKASEKYGTESLRNTTKFLILACNQVIEETNAANKEELVFDTSDPVHGSTCYTWANITRNWWQQNVYRSMMEAQAESALETPVLYGMLLDTMDGIVNRDPLIGKAVESNGWNQYCVARLTGRRS